MRKLRPRMFKELVQGHSAVSNTGRISPGSIFSTIHCKEAQQNSDFSLVCIFFGEKVNIKFFQKPFSPSPVVATARLRPRARALLAYRSPCVVHCMVWNCLWHVCLPSWLHSLRAGHMCVSGCPVGRGSPKMQRQCRYPSLARPQAHAGFLFVPFPSRFSLPCQWLATGWAEVKMASSSLESSIPNPMLLQPIP